MNKNTNNVTYILHILNKTKYLLNVAHLLYNLGFSLRLSVRITTILKCVLNLRRFYDSGKNCRQFSFQTWTSLIGQFSYPVGGDRIG